MQQNTQLFRDCKSLKQVRNEIHKETQIKMLVNLENILLITFSEKYLYYVYIGWIRCKSAIKIRELISKLITFSHFGIEVKKKIK